MTKLERALLAFGIVMLAKCLWPFVKMIRWMAWHTLTGRR